MRPALTLLNRVWPLLFATLGASILSVFEPQVAAVASGFCIIWALAWRRQASAVAAIEERDAVRFYIDRTSPLQPIQLVRTPGFGGEYLSRVNREHEEIYAAIARRDPESARAAMRIHLTNSRERLRIAQEAARQQAQQGADAKPAAR